LAGQMGGSGCVNQDVGNGLREILDNIGNKLIGQVPNTVDHKQ